MSTARAFDRMSYSAEEYRTARARAKRWNASASPIDRQAIECTLDRGGISALVEVRPDMFGELKMMAKLDPNRSRCADNHMRLPMLETILSPAQVEIAGYGLRPWTDAPTDEELHVSSMKSAVAL